MSARLKLTLSMIIFGTIGIFRRHMAVPSGTIALFRGLIGTMFLVGLLCLRRKRPDCAAVRRNLLKLLISGAAMGFNWILLFEAYNYTSVATATLCYYFAPMFIILASPWIVGERLTARKMICVGCALAGMVFVSGVLRAGFGGIAELRGVALSLGAAVLYAGVVLLNKTMTSIDAFDRTIVQLGASAAALLPYVCVVEPLSQMRLECISVLLLLVVGVVHTGIAYALYFGSLSSIAAQTAAIFSYIDPVLAVLLSAVLLREQMDVFTALGAALILGAAIASERGSAERSAKSNGKTM